MSECNTKPEFLIDLVGTRNFPAVDDEWMKLVESAEMSPEQFACYREVLAALYRAKRTEQAETLAWAALEQLTARFTPREVLTAAGPFLLAVNESGSLREQTTELYREAFAGRDGLEELLNEAGIAGGRPVRRALRTLDVCLAIDPGGFLRSRDEDGAARVDQIDADQWRYTINTGSSSDELGSVELADKYEPADESDFRVMATFAREELIARLQRKPGDVVVEICRSKGDFIDSDQLEQMLVPAFIAESDWKKWWTRARAALKKNPNAKLDGRSPYTVSYLDIPIAFDELFLEEFESQRDPGVRLALFKKYMRECKLRQQEVPQEAVTRCYDRVSEEAREIDRKDAKSAGLHWLVCSRIGELIGIENASEGLSRWLGSNGIGDLFGRTNEESLLALACTALAETEPSEWKAELASVLPTLPLGVCDHAAKLLVEAGFGPEEFEPIVQQILAFPVRHFESLLWLWERPSPHARIIDVAPRTVLMRIVRALDEVRRSDKLDKDSARKMAARARTVLSARKFERFHACLGSFDPSMAVTLRTQLRRLDNLGRAVREDLSGHISRMFPSIDAAPVEAPWERDDVLYVTGKGLGRRQEEIDHHVNVKMRDNARAIGEAAQKGDLSENSEYKFALEERDLLRARLAQMNAEVAIASVINVDEIPTDLAGIGTRIELQRVQDGEQYTMTLTGPWEADGDKAWFNYRTPLAGKVLGRKIGDEVDFDHTGASGRYRIVALTNGLDDLFL